MTAAATSGAPELRVGPPAVARTEQGWRLEAEVLEAPLWFSSRDRKLEPSSEAFGSALLLAGLAVGRRLRIDAAVSAAWLSNTKLLLEVLGEWWGYPFLEPVTGAVRDLPGAPGRTTALCFGGGVDSMHALLSEPDRADALLFVSGYDISLDDRARASAAERSMREVAAATGTEAIVVTTNLRDHPAYKPADWEHSHGGALAAVGHAVTGVDRLRVAAAYPYALEHWAWGTHSRIDRLWSSEALSVRTAGAEAWRWQKVSMLASHPLAHRHLRVCWEHRNESINCSRCEKCVRTMLELAACGRLPDFEVFNPPAALHVLVDDVPAIAPTLRDVYADITARTTDRRLRRSLRRLMERSEPSRRAWWTRFTRGRSRQ